MALTAQVRSEGRLADLPTAKELKEQIAIKEAEKVAFSAQDRSGAEAEKRALLEKIFQAVRRFR
jgi:hypothetical protein